MANKISELEAMYEKSKRKSFPGIPEIDCEQLREMQASGNVQLVDVRTPEEQAVSMMPGAVTAEYLEEHADDYRGRTLVAYCTIGGRSGQYTAMMKERGWDIYNLKGAIAAWTHAGGELTCDGQPTKRVHVHGPRFDLVADGYEPVW